VRNFFVELITVSNARTSALLFPAHVLALQIHAPDPCGDRNALCRLRNDTVASLLMAEMNARKNLFGGIAQFYR
jgi:hypothetical protein